MSLISQRTHMINRVMEIIETELVDYIDGPFEGEDYWTEDDFIYVGNKNFVLAANIMRKVNNSGDFNKRLVKIRTAADVITLGFDSLLDAEPVFTVKIGPTKEKTIELKESEEGRIVLYINKERSSATFKTLKASKSYIKKLDKTLCSEDEFIS